MKNKNLDNLFKDILVKDGSTLLASAYVPTDNQSISTKKYVDAHGIRAWVDGVYVSGANVSSYGCFYEATEDIVAGDDAPGSTTTAKWTRVAGTRVSFGSGDKAAVPKDGDFHYYSETGQTFPRPVYYIGGRWREFFTNIQIKPTSSNFNFNLGPTVAYQKGTTADPQCTLYLHGEEEGLDASYKIDKLWGTAWGYVGGGRVGKSTLLSNSGIHGRTHFKAVKGRYYKINCCIPIASGPKEDKTRWYARLNVNGGWIEHGIDGGFWEEGHGESIDTCFGHVSMQPIYACHENKDSMDVHLYFSTTTSDTKMLTGFVSIEDIGPITR